MDFINRRPASLSAGEKRRIGLVFSECDREHKGYLGRHDFKVACVALLGYKPSNYEQQKVLQLCSDLFDDDGQPIEGLCLRHFEEAMQIRLQRCDPAEEIRQVFLAFDRKCQGFLTLADLEAAVAKVVPRIPATTVTAVFRELDRDGDGRVAFKDFDFMMRYECQPESGQA